LEFFVETGGIVTHYFLLKKQLVAGDKMRTFHQKAIITCQFSVFVVTTGF
jgi:hypothetical protein